MTFTSTDILVLGQITQMYPLCILRVQQATC